MHVVFTLPRELAPLALQNKRLIYNLLFRASAETLLEIARDPRHLGAEIGFFSVLHTWDQRLQHHPHVHCVLPPAASLRIAPAAPSSFPSECSVVSSAASLSPDLTAFHAARSPVPRTSLTARGTARLRLVAAGTVSSRLGRLLQAPFRRAERVLRCSALTLIASPFPTAGWLLLPTATSPFARAVSAHGNQKRLIALPVEEFLRRFLLHLLPRGFMRIRNFGFLANRRRAELLPLCLRCSSHPVSRRHAPRRPRYPFTR